MTRSWVRVVIGALALVIGLVWLLQSAGLIDFPLRALLPIALIVVGLGLIGGARHGTQPLLLTVGIILTVLLMFGSNRSWNVSTNRGFAANDRIYAPNDADDLRPYRVDAGQLTLDLTRLRLEKRTYEVEARVGAGQILAIVPSGVPVRVEARSGAGRVEVFGKRRTSGISTDDVFESPDFDEDRPRISLELTAGVGSIRVVTRSPGERGRPGRFDFRFDGRGRG